MSKLRVALSTIAVFAGSGCLDAGTDVETTASEVSQRVEVCHVPPGNAGASHTIQVAHAALNAHIAHGDRLGRCEVCAPGELRSCYVGPAGTEGVGICAAGAATCNAEGTGFGACVGSVVPVAEACGDARDNDCDGVVDEGCADVTPPTLTISAPPAEGEASGANVEFTLQTNEPSTICWRLDGGAPTCSAPAVTTFGATLYTLTAGWHTLEVSASDLADNASTSSRTWIVSL